MPPRPPLRRRSPRRPPPGPGRGAGGAIRPLLVDRGRVAAGGSGIGTVERLCPAARGARHLSRVARGGVRAAGVAPPARGPASIPPRQAAPSCLTGCSMPPRAGAACSEAGPSLPGVAGGRFGPSRPPVHPRPAPPSPSPPLSGWWLWLRRTGIDLIRPIPGRPGGPGSKGRGPGPARGSYHSIVGMMVQVKRQLG